MFDFLREHQLNIMSDLSAICCAITLFIFVSNIISQKRKIRLMILSFGSAMLLFFDKMAYTFRGIETTEGFIWVRVSNYLVYALTLALQVAFIAYLSDLLKNEGGLKKTPKRLTFGYYLAGIGELLLLISQLTGFYYTFDRQNRYERGPGFYLCYIIPLILFIIILTAILQYGKNINKNLRVSLIIFAVVPMIAGIVQIFTYGLSLTNMSFVGTVIVLYIFIVLDSNEELEKAKEVEISHLKDQQDNLYKLFDQTATAFVGTIDAKDKYTKGHSVRVAKYAKMIARMAGKNEDECRDVYYAALLHEIGKIGISDSILTKERELTEEEYATLKTYPTIGKEILSNITEYPFLSIGAYTHHERYDGKGYPQGLSGEDIPEIGRIIAVADAYDTMTSQRSYRDPIPQQKVREEFVKGMGTQFDPQLTKYMIHMIDLDSEYEMQERVEVTEFSETTELDCDEYRSQISEGVAITSNMVRIKFLCKPNKKYDENICVPALILFDSLDGRVHTSAKDIDSMNYFEYAEIWFDGHATCSGARNLKNDFMIPEDSRTQREVFDAGESIEYELQAVKYADHALLRLICEYGTMEETIALPDSSRFLYVAFTGEHCHIDSVKIEHDEEPIDENYITRIADEVSYINRLEGDVPNIQVDGYRTDATEGVEVVDGMEIYFHAMSLPTARLVWHCPFINIFYSEDGKPQGVDYREYALIRLDGEAWEEGEFASNKIHMKKEESFKGWDYWKSVTKEGFDCSVVIRRSGNKVTTMTKNNGIEIKNVTTIKDSIKKIYVSLTGDQVALTDIRIRK